MQLLGSLKDRFGDVYDLSAINNQTEEYIKLNTAKYKNYLNGGWSQPSAGFLKNIAEATLHINAWEVNDNAAAYIRFPDKSTQLEAHMKYIENLQESINARNTAYATVATVLHQNDKILKQSMSNMCNKIQSLEPNNDQIKNSTDKIIDEFECKVNKGEYYEASNLIQDIKALNVVDKNDLENFEKKLQEGIKTCHSYYNLKKN